MGCLSVDGIVCGIAQLDNEVFVASESSTSIAVFSFQGRQNFSKQQDVVVGQLTTPPRDIAASAKFEKLFVAGCGGVWQLARSSWGQWKMEGQAVTKVEPVSLSVNATRLLVTERRRLTVLDIDKRKRKLTSLPENVRAEHALETSWGTFVVCGRVAAEKPGVMEVNRRGGVVRMCDPRYLGLPCYLSAFSGDEADFLAVDSVNQSVILLSSGLDVVRVFLDRHHDGVAQPRRVVKYGYFLVGHSKSFDDRLGLVSLYGPHKSALQPLPDQ